MMLRLNLFVVCILAASLSLSAAEEEHLAVDTWSVYLQQAITQEGRPARSLRLILRRHGDDWWPLMGDAPEHNKSLASGIVVAEAGQLRVTIHLPGDAWVPGGIGSWTIASDGQGNPVSGPWHGQWLGTDGSGEALVLPWTPAMASTPRAALRQHSLWLDGDVARQMTDHLSASDPLSLAVAAVAEPAVADLNALMEAAHKVMADREAGGGRFYRGYPWGDRARSLALTWDALRGQLNAEQEQAFRGYFNNVGRRLLTAPWSMADRSYWDPDSRFTAQLRGAGAVVAVVYAGQPGPAPAAPNPPAPVLTIAADGGAQGISNPGNAERISGQWLVAGPLASGGLDDQQRTAIVSGQHQDLRSPEDGVGLGAGDNRGRLDLSALTGRDYGKHWLLVSSFELSEAMSGNWRHGAMNAQVQTWISGVAVDHGQGITLEAGRHSIIALVHYGRTANSWDGLWLAPHLHTAALESLNEELARAQARHALDEQVHAAALRMHRATDGADVNWLDRLTPARALMHHWHRLAVAGGEASEGDVFLWSSAAAPLEFEWLHRLRFGGGVAPAGSSDLLLARVLRTQINHGQEAQPGFSQGGSTMPDGMFWRAWQVANAAGQHEGAARATELRQRAAQLASDPVALALALAADLPAATAPQLGHVGQGRGSIFFRNAQGDGQDIVVGITAAHTQTNGARRHDAGDVVLFGGGIRWVDGAAYDSLLPLRHAAAVVDAQDPSQRTPSAPGILRDHALHSDGSGWVVMDFPQTFSPVEGDTDGVGRPLQDRLGLPVGLPVGQHRAPAQSPAQSPAKSTAKWRRSLATHWHSDGSAIIVLRDVMTAAPATQWILPIDPLLAQVPEAALTITNGQHFQISTPGGWSLHGHRLGDGEAWTASTDTLSNVHYQRASERTYQRIRYDLAGDADSVVVLVVGTTMPPISRDGQRILVARQPRFMLHEDGSVRPIPSP